LRVSFCAVAAVLVLFTTHSASIPPHKTTFFKSRFRVKNSIGVNGSAFVVPIAIRIAGAEWILRRWLILKLMIRCAATGNNQQSGQEKAKPVVHGRILADHEMKVNGTDPFALHSLDKMTDYLDETTPTEGGEWNLSLHFADHGRAALADR
jgi:hypothetical protein